MKQSLGAYKTLEMIKKEIGQDHMTIPQDFVKLITQKMMDSPPNKYSGVKKLISNEFNEEIMKMVPVDSHQFVE